ncbi:MAG: hypothetical protein HXX13_09315 [Bacteroidetes bacterium]|nr:hypothetical protein [Bacteroidota bacterium]
MNKLALYAMLVLVFVVPGFRIQAQSQVKQTERDTVAKPGITAIARNYGDSIVIRWAPGTPTLWQEANQNGYMLIRREVSVSSETKDVKLTSSPLKPLSLSEWGSRFNSGKDQLAATAAQVLYGKSMVDIGKNPGLAQMMEKSMDEQNNFGIALFLADYSPGIASGMALRWVDKSFDKSKSYVYFIFPAVSGKGIVTDTATVFVDASEVAPRDHLPVIRIEELDHQIRFTWRTIRGLNNFTAYFFERSEDGGKTFRKLNETPKIFSEGEQDQASGIRMLSFVDSVPQNYKKYTYRFYGINAFGDRSQPTDNMTAIAVDRTAPPAPSIMGAENFSGNQVRITWKENTISPDFKGYLVGRANSFNGPFKPLVFQFLPGGTTTFVDPDAHPDESNVYVVTAVDTSGNSATSMPFYAIMKDTIPPAAPTGMKYTIDSLGNLKLMWNPGKEKDILGYLVYRANAPDHVFTPVAKDFITDTVFYDTLNLNTLTRKAYYKLVCFDNHRNPSNYSDYLEVVKPDRIPPVSAVFNKFLVSDTSVVLNWAPSSSADLEKQLLYRRESDSDNDWKLIATLDKNISGYMDTNVKPVNFYTYSIISVDETGLRSLRSFPLKVRVYDRGIRPGVKQLTGEYDSQKKVVTLSWVYSPNNEYYCQLFRSVDGEHYTLYANVERGKNSMIDRKVAGSQVYYYKIKSVFIDGSESGMSSPVTVSIK